MTPEAEIPTVIRASQPHEIQILGRTAIVIIFSRAYLQANGQEIAQQIPPGWLDEKIRYFLFSNSEFLADAENNLQLQTLALVIVPGDTSNHQAYIQGGIYQEVQKLIQNNILDNEKQSQQPIMLSAGYVITSQNEGYPTPQAPTLILTEGIRLVATESIQKPFREDNLNAPQVLEELGFTHKHSS